MESRIIVKQESGVVIITLNHVEKRNALSIAMLKQLCQAIEQTIKEPNNRVLIITANGPVFCAGLDLKEAADPNMIEESTKYIQELFRAIFACPLVTIAAVQGASLAGGAGIVAACDYVVAVESAKIGFPEVKRGLVAAFVANLLCHKISPCYIKELLLFGEMVDANRAQTMGLFNRIVAEDQLMQVAMEQAKIVLKNAPGAIKTTKQLLHTLMPFEGGFETAQQIHHQVRHSDEAVEGTRAFLEKRTPSWIRSET